MAYKFGQLTKKSIGTQPFTKLICKESTSNRENRQFEYSNFQQGSNYVITFNITLPEEYTPESDTQIVNIVLRKGNNVNTDLVVGSVDLAKTLNPIVVFSPVLTCNKLILQDKTDYLLTRNDNYFTKCDIYNLSDLCNRKDIGWSKIGFYGRPGETIVVNNEPIVIGRNYMYELNNGIKIRSFSILPNLNSEEQEIDAFVLDYMYQEGQ